MVSIAFLALGLLALFGRDPNGRLAGGLWALGNLAFLAWQIHVFWKRAQAERARRAALLRREALRVARRERALQQKMQRRAARALKVRAAARQAETRAQQQDAEAQLARAEAARRAERERTALADAARWAALSNAELPAAVAALFTARGRTVQNATSEAACDLWLDPDRETEFDVARCVPVERQAGASDVQALEAWRTQAQARHAYLIAPAGFTPAGIRLAQRLPITLVEAHLLAHWNQDFSS